LVNPAVFTPFAALERLEVRGGRAGARDWEWGLGVNTQAAGQFASGHLEWVSGRVYAWTLAYDGSGAAALHLRHDGAVVLSLAWPNGMDAGNALRFYVKANSDVGAGNGVVVSIGTINGRPVNRTIQASGSNQFVEEVAVYQTAQGAFTAEGTVAISYTGTAPPAGSRLNFIVTAGNVPCEGTEASTALYYVHADHLNTPRALVDAQNRVVWRWDSDPFGVTAASEDPDGDGKAVTMNLRFPGQYFDRETNLHYNYFRDYDPQTGRYVQSDPIGLAGGINTYAYVGGNPLSFADLLGLAASGGPYHQPEGVSLRCTQADSCPQIKGKMWVLERLIRSHQGWDWNNPPPQGGGRHATEIVQLWRAYARCQTIWERKCVDCPPEESGFSKWWRSLTDPRPKPAPDPAEELLGQSSRHQSSGVPGGAAGPFPTLPLRVFP
jgi:RHS repeat-associated protein